MVADAVTLDASTDAHEIWRAAPFTRAALVGETAFATGWNLATAVIGTFIAAVGDGVVARIVQAVAPFRCIGVNCRVCIVAVNAGYVPVAVAVALSRDTHAVLAHVCRVRADDPIAWIIAHAGTPVATGSSRADDSLAGVLGSHALAGLALPSSGAP